MLYKHGKRTCNFWGRFFFLLFIFIYLFIFLYFGCVFNEIIILLALVKYERLISLLGTT